MRRRKEVPGELPKSRYDGEGGEVTAWARPADAPHDVEYRSGGTANYLATGAPTGGLFGSTAGT